MADANKFILSTDFATLKNDDSGTATVTVPGSMSVAAGATWSSTSTVTLGEGVSTVRANCNASRTSDWYNANQLSIWRTGTVGGSPTTYTLLSKITRTSSSTVELYVGIYNNYASTLTTQSGSETITYKIATFLPPFN